MTDRQDPGPPDRNLAPAAGVANHQPLRMIANTASAAGANRKSGHAPSAVAPGGRRHFVGLRSGEQEFQPV